jgi:hypothetical protein
MKCKFEFVVTSILMLFCATVIAEEAKDFNIAYMLRTNIFAKSSAELSNLRGSGFGSSDNAAQKIEDKSMFKESGFFLKLDNAKKITYEVHGINGKEKINGYNLYIVNKSKKIVKIEACDSRLPVVAEVFIDDKWQPIEYLPQSWCGNSYHEVGLNKNEYWKFNVPKYDGKIKTKIRYKLDMSSRYNRDTDNTGKEKFIYSNEVETKINKEQLKDKPQYKSGGIMDPSLDTL